ncbi:SUKH-3 domain-containing protein [Hymenobacter latericus]|uniref:SUKH-3 domain-containing protein n=1 Tax=Hymenobacter sp. YIM 151858-1 TaxID=2987688 RepID=UPI002226030B|nr:SUKH-3 domain-containing protein [Hymenobacter sp. YIM 151858-1]UYZ58269.1 SUKH-3 domain-containing protein [Hymenobacter sp. YIM 151858-1]
MTSFSDEVLHLLQEAGWYRGRSVDTHRYAAAIRANKFPWQEPAQRFLSEFGGLLLRFLRSDGSVTTLHFNVAQALASHASSQVLNDCMTRLGAGGFTVIGQAYAEDLLLLMDAQGRVYGGGCDDCLYLIANSGAEAIETICLDLAFEVVAAA